MNKKIKLLVIVTTFLAAIINITSCNKPGTTGLDLVQNSDGNLNAFHTDTFTITTYSEVIDSMRTSQLSTYLLGSYYDDVFGVTSSSIYTQLRLYDTDIDFGTNPQCDSIVLSFVIDKIYGDTNAIHNISVYEMIESIDVDSIYYHLEDKDVDPTPIGQGSYQFSLDSIMIDSQKVKPQLRIRLDNSFAEKIMAKSGESELSDNDNFLEFINGIKIQVEKATSIGGGSIGYFDLGDTQTEMRIWYSNDDEDSLDIGFAINEYCGKFAHYDHYNYDEASTEFKNQVLNGDTTLGNNVVYLQPLAGVQTYIKFPNITDIIDSGMVAINEAKIYFYPQSGSFINDSLPSQLVMVRINELGNDVFLEDYAEGDNYFGGALTDDSYYLNLSLYIQKILTGEIENNGLHLLITGSGVSVNRAIFNGPEAADSQMKLKIIYSKIN